MVSHGIRSWFSRYRGCVGIECQWLTVIAKNPKYMEADRHNMHGRSCSDCLILVIRSLFNLEAC